MERLASKCWHPASNKKESERTWRLLLLLLVFFFFVVVVVVVVVVLLVYAVAPTGSYWCWYSCDVGKGLAVVGGALVMHRQKILQGP